MNSTNKQLGLISALAVSAIALTAQIETVNSMEGNVERSNRCSEAADVEQYWTPERMRNAQPLPLPSPETEPAPPTESNSELSNPNSAAGEASPPSQIDENQQY